MSDGFTRSTKDVGFAQLVSVFKKVKGSLLLKY